MHQSQFTLDQARQNLQSWKSRLSHLKQRRARLDLITSSETLAEIREICEHKIPHLLAMIEESPGEYIDNHTGHEIKSLGRRVEQLVSKQSGISFINREVELKEIVSPLAPTFILVEAPAGYGKTFLLNETREPLEQAGWHVCFLDLTQHPEVADYPQTFLKLIYDSLPADFPDKSRPLPNDTDYARDALIGRLSRHFQRFALLLDGAERIRDPNWVRDQFIYKLQDRLRQVVGSEFRCIVAGRYVAQTWRDPRSKYSLANECFAEPIRLTPFTSNVILEATERLSREGKYQSQLQRDAMEQVAQGVRIISGGHPQCLIHLLLELDVDHSLNPLPSYFNDFEGLFAQHVQDVCCNILADIPASLVDIFRFLCLFRCYNEEIVRTVIAWAGEKGQLGPQAERDAGRVLQQLIQRGIVVWDERKRFYVDDVIRRVIALQQRLRHQALADELNVMAMNRYDDWLDNPPLLDPARYQAMILEHLYHHSVHLVRSKTTPDDVCSKFQAQLLRNVECFESKFQQSLDPFELEESLKTLIKTLQANDDLRAEMITRLGGKFTFEELLEPLVKRIAANKGE